MLPRLDCAVAMVAATKRPGPGRVDVSSIIPGEVSLRRKQGLEAANNMYRKQFS